MKIWQGYGSEHSYNLMMIGRFKNSADAAKAKEAIDQLTSSVDEQAEVDSKSDRYSDGMLGLLTSLKLHGIEPQEFEQFRCSVSVELKENEVTLWTDEGVLSAFLKVLVDSGARVEVYSTHDYPDQEKGK